MFTTPQYFIFLANPLECPLPSNIWSILAISSDTFFSNKSILLSNEISKNLARFKEGISIFKWHGWIPNDEDEHKWKNWKESIYPRWLKMKKMLIVTMMRMTNTTKNAFSICEGENLIMWLSRFAKGHNSEKGIIIFIPRNSLFSQSI